jgi:hypothetical protein
MHPIKPVTLGLQRVKGGEKNQSKGEGYAEKGKGGLKGGRDMQRRGVCREGDEGAKRREGYAEKGKGG